MRLGLRPLAPPLLFLAVFLLSGCGSSEKKTDTSGQSASLSVWPGPPDAASDGRMPVERFNLYLRDRSGAASPTALALEFAGAAQTQAARTTTEAQASPEGGGPTTVTVTFDGLADDSVRATRFVLRFEPEGDKWRLDAAVRTQACRQGRGHEAFGPADCL